MLTGCDQQRRARLVGVVQHAHRVAETGRDVDVHGAEAAARLCVAVRHRDGDRFLQREHVADVGLAREPIHEGKLRGAGVAEHHGHAFLPENVEERLFAGYVCHGAADHKPEARRAPPGGPGRERDEACFGADPVSTLSACRPTTSSSGPRAASRPRSRRSGSCARPAATCPSTARMRARLGFLELCKNADAAGRGHAPAGRAPRRGRGDPLRRHPARPRAAGRRARVREGRGAGDPSPRAHARPTSTRSRTSTWPTRWRSCSRRCARSRARARRRACR